MVSLFLRSLHGLFQGHVLHELRDARGEVVLILPRLGGARGEAAGRLGAHEALERGQRGAREALEAWAVRQRGVGVRRDGSGEAGNRLARVLDEIGQGVVGGQELRGDGLLTKGARCIGRSWAICLFRCLSAATSTPLVCPAMSSIPSLMALRISSAAACASVGPSVGFRAWTLRARLLRTPRTWVALAMGPRLSATSP